MAASRRTGFMMRMLFERRRARPVPRAGAVAVQAKFIGRLAELRVVVRTVHIVAIETGDAAAVHHTLREIVSLHAVLVGRAVGKMRKAQFAQLVLLELPVILQLEPNVIADRPVVIIAFDRIGERAAL